jgi:hypothetical protein
MTGKEIGSQQTPSVRTSPSSLSLLDTPPSNLLTLPNGILILDSCRARAMKKKSPRIDGHSPWQLNWINLFD